MKNGKDTFQPAELQQGLAAVFRVDAVTMESANPTYSPGLRLLGVGRNQYIDLMNQCRSSKVRNLLLPHIHPLIFHMFTLVLVLVLRLAELSFIATKLLQYNIYKYSNTIYDIQKM